MSYRYWIAAIALGLGVTSSALAQQEQPTAVEDSPITKPRQEQSASTSNKDSSQQQESPADLAPALNRIESAIRDLIAEEDQTQRRNQEAREQRDLAAQEQMAHWAKLMFFATLATVLLTFAALAAIIRTLHHTRRAADYAEDMVEQARTTNTIAQEANETTRLALVNDKRAWLSIEAFSVIGPTIFRKDVLGFKIKVVIKNLGQTPAKDVWVESVSIYLSEKDESFPERIASHKKAMRRKPENFGIILFPGDTYTVTHTWEDAPEKFNPAIRFHTGRQEDQIGVVFLITVSYRIHGSSEVHITHKQYGIQNVPFGFELPEGKEMPINPMPFISGEAD